jgi:hypothetical protein
MTLELAYATEARHFHWSSVKLAYLIGRETRHLLPSLRHQILGWTPGCPIDHYRNLNLTGRLNVRTDACSDTCPVRSKCVQDNKMHVFTAVTTYYTQYVYFRLRLRSLPVRNRHISLGNPVQNSSTRTAQNPNIVCEASVA